MSQYYLISEIPGFDGYLADSQGRIWKREGKSIKEMKSSINNTTGYLVVSLWENGTRKRKQMRVHRLVLLALVADPLPEQTHTRHLNGIREDNRLENLCWGTPKENVRDMIIHGHSLLGKENPTCQGERSPLSKMTDETAKIIYSCKGGIVHYSIIRKFLGVNHTIIFQVWKKAKWAHIHKQENWPEIPQEMLLLEEERKKAGRKKRAKLTPEDAMRIYNLKGIKSAYEIEEEYNLTKPTIYGIWRKSVWACIHNSK